MERMKKGLIVIASSLLLFCFPVYAEELEASELPIEEVLHDVELINDSTKEASEVPIDNLAEIQGSMLKAPSVNPDADFSILGYEIIEGSSDDTFKISLIVEGNYSRPLRVSIRLSNTDNFSPYQIDSNYTSVNIPIGSYVANIFNEVNDRPPTINYLIGRAINSSDIGYSSILNGEISSITDYLTFVSSVFAWLLTTIGVLIGFILGNPFLAVSLLLFMAGTIISFYIRIKNS